jgi:hypothetical protein
MAKEELEQLRQKNITLRVTTLKQALSVIPFHLLSSPSGLL